MKLDYSIDLTAKFEPCLEIGSGSSVGAFCELRKNIKIGSNTKIDSYVCMTGDAIIGDNVTIRNRCTIARGVEIGDNTFISPHCMFQNLNTEKHKVGGAKIGSNCFIGTGVVFKEGVTVCDGVTIGSMSYVNKDITEPGIYLGTPIRKYEG